MIKFLTDCVKLFIWTCVAIILWTSVMNSWTDKSEGSAIVIWTKTDWVNYQKTLQKIVDLEQELNTLKENSHD